MTFDEFTDALYAAGWNSPNDAQHERIKAVWLEMETAADYWGIKWAAADKRLSMIRTACDAVLLEQAQDRNAIAHAETDAAQARIAHLETELAGIRNARLDCAMKVHGKEIPRIVLDALRKRLQLSPALNSSLVDLAADLGCPHPMRTVDRWLQAQRRCGCAIFSRPYWHWSTSKTDGKQ